MNQDLKCTVNLSVSEFDHTVSSDMEFLFSIFQEWNSEYHFDHDLFVLSFSQLPANNSKIFIARINGVIVGYAQVTARLQLGFPKYLEIDQILVTENRRKMGVGRELMSYAAEYARNCNIGSIRLESELARSIAHVFYERIGFKMTKASKFYEKNLAEA